MTNDHKDSQNTWRLYASRALFSDQLRKTALRFKKERPHTLPHTSLYPSCAAVLCLTASVLIAATPKGEIYLNEGVRVESTQDYETALQLYNYALSEDPHDAAYAKAAERARHLVIEQLLAKGRELLQSQNRLPAKLRFQKVLQIDPQSHIASEEIRKIDQQLSALLAPVALKPVNDPLARVHILISSPRLAYRDVCDVAGIAVTFDPVEIDPPNRRLHDAHFADLSSITVTDALNYVAAVTNTSWHAVDSKTIYVTGSHHLILTQTPGVPDHSSPSPLLSAFAPEDALRVASRAGKLADVVHLVLEGANLNAPDSYGLTPLLFAITGNNPEVVRFLLDRGANTRAALHTAISLSNLAIVRLLLTAHADPEALDSNGNTALDQAVIFGHEDIVRLLLSAGANAAAARFPSNRNLLHQVCAKGSATLIPMLVDSGADPLQRDQFGETPLDLALANQNENAVAALLKLPKQKAQLRAAAGAAMQDATMRGYTQIARMLLEHGLDGSPYLGDAALKGHVALVRLLLDHGASVKLRNKFGGTVLHDAAIGGSPEIIDLLLDHGAQIDARDSETHATPLMVAISLGHAQAAAALIKRGADPRSVSRP